VKQEAAPRRRQWRQSLQLLRLLLLRLPQLVLRLRLLRRLLLLRIQQQHQR
jgi:hypothetical protein